MDKNHNNLKEVLHMDCTAETEKITTALRRVLTRDMRKRGVVVGLSGGIDSSVTLALCVEAVGKDRILALLLPDRDSSADSTPLGRKVADTFGVQTVCEDITDILTALNVYDRYAEAIQSVIPEYRTDWKSKILTSHILDTRGITFFSVLARSPDGREIKKRLDLQAYLSTVAAMNFKQRTRKMMEYYHADRLNYAVAGTPNRLEYDLGFFVKNGDGAADVKPIAHLYKTQVYQLARHLHLPEEIIERQPTTDTYSLSQGQDEFYFSLPHEKMDLCLYGKNNKIPTETVAAAIGLSGDQVDRVYKDISRKRTATKYLHLPAVLAQAVPEISISTVEGGVARYALSHTGA